MPLYSGTDADEFLGGGAENDTLEGRGGADTLSGGLGDDRLWGGAVDDFTGQNTGDDSLVGGPGNDFLSGGDGADTISGGDDRDFLSGGRGADSLSGGAGNDDVNGDLSDLFVDAGDGNDNITITGPSEGESTRLSLVTGGAGNDRFVLIDLVPTQIVVDGGSGTNTLQALWNSFRLPTVPIDFYLNQPHEGQGVVATGFVSLNVETASAHIFAGDGAETITTSGENDQILGGGGNDMLTDNQSGFGAGAVQESIFGGAGDDRIFAGGGNHYLRGDEGADSIMGGVGFDDINGNMGNDTLAGRSGDDWTVGGKDDDQLDGGDGNDLVYGNLGRDICIGGEGNDIVRGGQDDDVLSGGGGDDFVSGDRGADTITGGSGADTFHSFQDAGLDRVKDFSQVQGDRVLLDPGTTFSVSQVGADTVIDFGGGNQMILEGVALATLRDGWISGGATVAPSNPVGPATILPGFAPANFAASAYDATRDVIYVASSDGLVRSWNFLTGASQTVANVGGKPSSLAITPDGRFLLVGDAEAVVQAPPTNGSNGFGDPRTDTITRLNLQTLVSDKITYTVSGGERGVSEVAVARDGQAYVIDDFGGSGTVTFWTFDPAAASPILTDVLGAGRGVGQRSAIAVSETGRYLTLFDTTTSPGGFVVFDSATDKPIFPSVFDSPVRNSNIGTGDISEAAGQIVQVQATGLYVWNFGASITFAKDLTAFTTSGDLSTPAGRVIGAHFSGNGQFLYLWDVHQDTILAVDRTTWTAVGAVQVKADVSYDFFSTHQGEMQLTPSGQYLILDTGKGLEVIDLAAQLSIRRTGTDAGERLNGDIGRDTLDGGAGNDFLIGYGGDDVLTGGAGGDIFHAQANGGIDRVTDFSRAQGDRVELDPGAQYTLSQIGADTVINFAGGGQMILAGVQMSTLAAGWIFGG
jgi:Ca2+-binding RTX toxin-like protein